MVSSASPIRTDTAGSNPAQNRKPHDLGTSRPNCNLGADVGRQYRSASTRVLVLSDRGMKCPGLECRHTCATLLSLKQDKRRELGWWDHLMAAILVQGTPPFDPTTPRRLILFYFFYFFSIVFGRLASPPKATECESETRDYHDRRLTGANTRVVRLFTSATPTATHLGGVSVLQYL